MISLNELNPHSYSTTPEIANNLNLLLDAINKVRAVYGLPMTVTSGLRSNEDQMRINPLAPKSKHLLGLACDIYDPDGKLWQWVLNNLVLMQQLGFYFEDKRWTKNWVHFQLGAPHSGKRIFIPSSAPPTAADIWDGKYDSKYDN